MILSKQRIYQNSPLDFSISSIPDRQEPRKVLMASPDYFDIIDVKNAHMEGQQGKLNKELARKQWEELFKIYTTLVSKGILEEVKIIPGVSGCEDMVFAANQTFPWVAENGEKAVVMSKMKHESRQREVPHFEKFFSSVGYKIIHLNQTRMFEGMGDTIPHPGKRLLYGGFGHRSDKDAYAEISELLNVKIVTLELVDERFYHLDTCFVPLDEQTVMLYPGAFSKEGMSLITELFATIIAIPLEEAAGNFALNAHAISNSLGKAAILHKGSKETYYHLENAGFEVFETDTSEYMKSGGSVFCMKMMYY